MTNWSLALTAEEVETLREQATDGSPEAARKLGAYYTIMEVNEHEAERWFTIGAENGDDVSMFNLWTVLKEDKDRFAQRRATYWLNRAATLGNERARNALLQLKGTKKDP